MKRQGRVKEVLMWCLIAASLVLMVYNTARYSGGANNSSPRPEIKTQTEMAGLRFNRSNGEEFVVPPTGKYLISFLTIDCGPCQSQIEHLERETRAGNYDRVIGVFYATKQKLAEFESYRHPQFLCLLKGASIGGPELSISTFPQTVEINNGTVTRVWVGMRETFD